MLKRLLLVALVAVIGLSTANAQFNKAELNFLKTPFKIQMNGDAVTGVRADGMSNTYGLPSVAEFMSKIRSINNDYSPPDWIGSITLVPTGCTTIYDLCSNGTPVSIWQDPNTPANIHAVFVTAPLGDGTTFPTRRSKYYFSTNFGATWDFITEVPAGERSGFPTISGFSDGTALISNHNPQANGSVVSVRAQAYKDLFTGLGTFTQLDAPLNTGPYIWPRVLPTTNLTIANKFVIVASMNGQDTTKYNTCTNINATPGTWLGWNYMTDVDQAETYALARGSNGNIGLVTKSSDAAFNADYGCVFFRESTNNGATFSAPTKIFQANFTGTGDSLGCIRGVSIVYQGTSPKVVFETLTLSKTTVGSYYPGLNAKIRFWSPSLTGSDPNKSIVLADTNSIGYHPYIGVADVLACLCRPSIGVSSDGLVLFTAFMVPSDQVGGSVDTTTFGDIYLTASGNNGNSWKKSLRLNPTTPRKDWRYVSVSPWNDKVGTDYYCNMTVLRDSIPGSYVNSAANGESLGMYYSMRVKVPGPVFVNQTSTEVPAQYSLAQNFPNPFNPTTNIKFAISKTGFVNLKVYDLAGREVSSLVNSVLTAGNYEYNFNGSNLSSGIYFYTLRADGFTDTKKMMLIK